MNHEVDRHLRQKLADSEASCDRLRSQYDDIRVLNVQLSMAHAGIAATLREKLAYFEHMAIDDRLKIGLLREALIGMVAEYDRLALYGSPMAKAANHRVANARAVIEQTAPPVAAPTEPAPPKT